MRSPSHPIPALSYTQHAPLCQSQPATLGQEASSISVLQGSLVLVGYTWQKALHPSMIVYRSESLNVPRSQ